MSIRSLLKQGVRLLPGKAQRAILRAYHRYSIAREPEPAAFAVIRHLVRDAQRVVDAGANMGVYTMFLAKYAPGDCEILCIEPVPTTFELLRSNIAALGLKSVRLLNLALSDRAHEVIMEIPADQHGLARIQYAPEKSHKSWKTWTVRALPLDEVLPQDQRKLAFIKIDVEMHELECLRGAARTIHEQQPAIYVEIQPDFKSKKSQRDEIISLLGAENYRPYFHDGSSLCAWHGESDTLDYFFLTRVHVASLMSGGLSVVEH